MRKQHIGGAWIGILILMHLSYLGILYMLQEPLGFVYGFPTSSLIVIAALSIAATINLGIGWLYLGKPDVAEIFSLQADQENDKQDSEHLKAGSGD